jgi:hypothetical protein
MVIPGILAGIVPQNRSAFVGFAPPHKALRTERSGHPVWNSRLVPSCVKEGVCQRPLLKFCCTKLELGVLRRYD